LLFVAAAAAAVSIQMLIFSMKIVVVVSLLLVSRERFSAYLSIYDTKLFFPRAGCAGVCVCV
jgi:hypothetical protein